MYSSLFMIFLVAWNPRLSHTESLPSISFSGAGLKNDEVHNQKIEHPLVESSNKTVKNSHLLPSHLDDKSDSSVIISKGNVVHYPINSTDINAQALQLNDLPSQSNSGGINDDFEFNSDPYQNFSDYYYNDAFTMSDPEFYNQLTIQKCYCHAQQIWRNGECSDFAGTFVGMRGTHNIIPVNTSWFGNIEIIPLKNCTENYTKTMFSGGNFYLYEDMHLFHPLSNLLLEPTYYCLEHILDAEEKLSWQAEVCLPPPTVQRCCKPGQGFNFSTKLCENISFNEFNPEIRFENTTFHHISGNVVKPECEIGHETKWVELTPDGASLSYTGEGTMMKWQPRKSMSVSKFPNEYCIGLEENSGYQTYWALFCHRDAVKEHNKTCTNRTCVRKCCGDGELFDTTKMICSNNTNQFNYQPTFHEMESGKFVEVKRPDDYEVIHGNPLCPDFFVMEPHSNAKDKFYVLSNGSLHVPDWDTSVPATNYCIDKWFYSDTEIKDHALVCFPPVAASSTCNKLSSTIYPAILVVSCVFLVITLAVYAAVPELHAKVHGKSLVSHVSALLVSYTSLVIVQLGSSSLQMSWCIIMGKCTFTQVVYK